MAKVNKDIKNKDIKNKDIKNNDIKKTNKKKKDTKKNVKKKKNVNLSNKKLKINSLSLKKKKYSLYSVILLSFMFLIVGFFLCIIILNILSGNRNYFKLSKDLSKFYDAYETLVDNYYGDIDEDALIDAAINGMVSSIGDAYTNYASIDATDEFSTLVSGTYSGIGCVIQQFEDKLLIITVYDDSPAAKAGLKAGDIIKTVDGMDALEEGIDNISKYIKTVAQEEIKMVVLRDSKELEFSLKRDKVEIPNISSKVITRNNKKVGYIYISLFSSVASKQFSEQLADLEKKNIDSLIIDVRDNSGGYLSSVNSIISQLLPKGSILYQVQKGDNKIVTKDKTSQKVEYPIAVLTNGNSASASEILAAAIKESYSGYVVGTKTYGKGTVQQTKKLSDGSMIKFTVENWLTPNGNWINEKGVEPTDKVELDDKYYENPIDTNDNQLQKALDLLTN